MWWAEAQRTLELGHEKVTFHPMGAKNMGFKMLDLYFLR